MADISCSDLDDQLVRCAAANDVAGIANLLARGANPLHRDSFALSMAAAQGHDQCLRLLIPASEPKAGFSLALRWAAQNGHAECVRLLIPASNPNILNSKPLRVAASRGHVECFQTLIPVSSPLIDVKGMLGEVLDTGQAGILAIMLAREPRFLERINLGASLDAAVAAGHSELAALWLSLIETQDIDNHLSSAPAFAQKPSRL